MNEYGQQRRSTVDRGHNMFAHRRSRASRASDGGFAGLGSTSGQFGSRRRSSMVSGAGIRRTETIGSTTSDKSAHNFWGSKSKLKTRVKPNIPKGVLAVHVKQVRLQHWNALQMFDRLDISVYVRIYVNGNCKWTSAYEFVTFPAMLILDDIKHFTLEISDRREDTANNIVIELVGFDRPDVHLVIARHNIHLYQIIKQLYAVETYSLTRLEKPVAELEVEYCFAYGQFGYGCANQLENRQIQPKEQVSHSMFVRLEPPEGRRGDRPMQDLMTCVPIGHPHYIPFTCKAEIGDVAMAYGSELDMCSNTNLEEPTFTIARIRKKLTNYQRHLGQIPTRKGRLNWLQDLVYNSKLTEDTTGEEVLVPHNFHVRRRTLMGPERHSIPPSGLMMPPASDPPPNKRHVRRISRHGPEELLQKYGIASQEHPGEHSAGEDEEDAKPKKGRWGAFGTMMNWLFSRKKSEDVRLPDETDEEMEERLIARRRSSGKRHRGSRFSTDFGEDVRETTIEEEDESEVVAASAGPTEGEPSTSGDVGSLGAAATPRRRSVLPGAVVEDSGSEGEDEKGDEARGPVDSARERRRKDSGAGGLSAEGIQGHRQRRGSMMTGLLDLWERVEKGEQKGEGTTSVGPDDAVKRRKDSTVVGKRDSLGSRKDSTQVSWEKRRISGSQGQASLAEEDEDEDVDAQTRDGSMQMKPLRGSAGLGSIDESGACKGPESEVDEKLAAEPQDEAQGTSPARGKKLWGALRIGNTLQVAISGDQRRRITEVVNRGQPSPGPDLLKPDYPHDKKASRRQSKGSGNLAVPGDMSAQSRRKSLMGRAGTLFRNMLAETATADVETRDHKIVVPRVMVTPSSPGDSSDSEFESD